MWALELFASNTIFCEHDNIINWYGTLSEGSIASNVMSENSAEWSDDVEDGRVLINEINVEPTVSALDGSKYGSLSLFIPPCAFVLRYLGQTATNCHLNCCCFE